MNPAKLVFIDETWTKTNMTRLYGRAPKGKRLVAAVPHGHWKTSTFIGALRCDGLTAPGVFDGAINGERFLEHFQADRKRPACSTSLFWRATLARLFQSG